MTIVLIYSREFYHCFDIAEMYLSNIIQSFVQIFKIIRSSHQRNIIIVMNFYIGLSLGYLLGYLLSIACLIIPVSILVNDNGLATCHV